MFPLNVVDRLDDEPLSAVLARVAFQVVARRWWDPKLDPKPDPVDFISYTARQMQDEGWPAIATWLQSMAYAGRLGVRASAWRNTVVRRSRIARGNRRAGKPWKPVPPC